MFVPDLTGDATTDGAVYVNGELLAQEGNPSPIKGRNWLSLSAAVVDLSNNLDYAYRGQLEGDPTTDEIIIANGSRLVQEGDVLPDTTGQPITGFDTDGPIYIDDDGQTFWYGHWTDPDLGATSGLFRDHSLLVQQNVATQEKFLFSLIAGRQDAFNISDNGRFMIFKAKLSGGDNGAFLIDFDPPCPWDLDDNTDVRAEDLLILLDAWGPNPGHPADFDGNCNVGVSDLLALLANWGPCT